MSNIRSVMSGTIRRLHRLMSKNKILVLGDSHVEVFSNRQFLLTYPKTYFDVCSVGGATASGLENPRSKTQAFQIFDKALKEKDYDEIIVMLGEVDTGFVIWYRAQKYDVDVMKMFKQAVDNYANFLDKVKQSGDLTVLSTPLPTINDSSSGEIAHTRKEITTTQKERVDLTLSFNQAIQRLCEEKNIKYINLDDKSLGKDGVVKLELKNKDPKDHHYDFNQYAKLIISKFKKFN
jgi:hypothetical protein